MGDFIAQVAAQRVSEKVLQLKDGGIAKGSVGLGRFQQSGESALLLCPIWLQHRVRCTAGLHCLSHHGLELDGHEMAHQQHVAMEAGNKSPRNAFMVAVRNPRAVADEFQHLGTVRRVLVQDDVPGRLDDGLRAQASAQRSTAEHPPP